MGTIKRMSRLMLNEEVLSLESLIVKNIACCI